jgi:hypothetical protein
VVAAGRGHRADPRAEQLGAARVGQRPAEQRHHRAELGRVLSANLHRARLQQIDRDESDALARRARR